jgi:PAS domain S-box-containing protein
MAVVLALSVMCQLTSAILALRLIRITKKKVAWLLVATGIIFMTLRRIQSLMQLESGGLTSQPDLVFEMIGLVISVLLLAGIYLIRPMFVSFVDSEKELLVLNAKLSVLSEEQRLLLQHTKDFIYRHDPQGIITYISPSVEQIAGYTPQEWLAHYATHYTDNPINKNGRDTTDEMLRTCAAGHPYVVEVRHKNGQNVYLEINKQPYFLDGKVAGFVGVARDISLRKHLEEERENLIVELQTALDNIKTLKGMLPICSSCKKVRDDRGYWSQIEAYVSEHSEAEFTHSICPECVRKLYPGYCDDMFPDDNK